MRVDLVLGMLCAALIVFMAARISAAPHFVESLRTDNVPLMESGVEVELISKVLHRKIWSPVAEQNISELDVPAVWRNRSSSNRGYRFPCSVRHPDWMVEKSRVLACFVHAPLLPEEASERAILCFSKADTGSIDWVIGHFDQGWPAGTWEGLLIPEDYGEKSWCGFPL